MGYSQSGVDMAQVQNLIPVFKWRTTIEGLSDCYAAMTGSWTNPLNPCHSGSFLTNYAAAPAQNDKVAIGTVRIPTTGEYTLSSLLAKTPASGIAHILLGNVDKGTIDCYAGVADDNAHVTLSLGALTAGDYAVSVIISTKNGASSDYKMYLQSLFIYLTP